MRIAEFLAPTSVIADLSATDASGVLGELALPLADSHFSVDKLRTALWDRERLGSTGMTDGVAIPHCKLEGLATLGASFGRSKDGIDFAALDGRPSRFFFALFAPENSAGLHLKALARISRLLKNPELRAALLTASDAAAIYHLMIEQDDRSPS